MIKVILYAESKKGGSPDLSAIAGKEREYVRKRATVKMNADANAAAIQFA